MRDRDDLRVLRAAKWFAAACAAVLALVAGARVAAAQGTRAEYQLRGEPHAGVPFHLDAVIEGLEESPAPAQPKLEIAGATVTPVAVQPNVSRSIQIINGRRIDSTRVTWVMRWRIVAPKPGRLAIPSLAITQGGKTATVRGAELQVDVIPTAPDMKLELQLPDRPVFVGETVPVKLVWLFQRGPQDDPEFSIPFTSLDTFTITTPPAPQGKGLEIDIGAKRVAVPFTVDKVTVAGEEYQRVTIELLAAPRTVPPGGKLEVPASSIAVPLAVGRPNFFGEAPKRMFRATDVARTLEVKPLPESGRPPAFAGAVGEQFSIEVRTSRSVVQLGEPVELDVTVKSDQRLDALALGKLDVEGRLPKDRFTVPDDPPTGELTDDGKTKTFKVVAQVTGPATEIPALAFSYFDPRKGTYQTIHSEPIALAVKGGSIVGASDVVAAPTKKPAAAVTDDSTLVNADLALSSPGAVDDQPLGGTLLWALIALLYAVPLAVLGFRTYQLRTASQREEAAEVRAARRRVEDLLDRASRDPARDVAGPLAAALRELARVLGRGMDDHGLLAKLETESFAPDAAGRPLSADLRSESAGLLRRWQQEARKRPSRAAIASILFVTVLAPHARADALRDGRAAYQQAMELSGDATARKHAFARAAAALGEAAHVHPDRPELLADWGNAALGAGDVATATLAYRRALAIDGGNARARHNLAWLRSRQADAFRPTTTASATDNLLFFHRWPRAHRLLVGAGAFAVAILLLVPWTGRRRRTLAGLAVIPCAVWIAMSVSLLVEDRRSDDAVVMDGVVLRAADSAGAPAALTTPLPRGAEVTVLERRDAWTRIRIANGTTGWIPAGAVQHL